MVILNLNPHTKGHLLVIPNEHVPRCAHLEREAQKEHSLLVNKSVEILKRSQEAGGLSADGVKVGLNFGAIAGASIPDHVHTQIVPLSVRENQEFLKRLLDEEDELPWDLKTLCAELQPAFCSMSLENNIHPEDDEWCDHKEGCMHCDIVHGRIPIMNNLVLERYKYNMAILKLASRARGQLCIIPHKHVEDPNQLSNEAQEEHWWLSHKSAEILEKAQEIGGLHADGVNITMNVGAMAGAKVNNHFVTEVEPRYQSELVRDGFFKRSREVSDIRWSLPKLHAELQPSFQKLKEESSS